MRRPILLFYRTAAAILRLVPMHRRYRAALAVARLFPRDRRHTRSPSLKRRPGASSLREMVLGTLLEAMDFCSVGYEPAIVLTGSGPMQAALRAGRGVLYAATHANGGLARLAVRVFHDWNVGLAPVTLGARCAVPGKALLIPSIRRDPHFMVAVRTRLRNGELVCALLDAYERTEQRPVEIRAAGGSLWVSDSLLRLAVACGAAIVFAAASLDDDGTIRVTIETLPDDADAERSRSEFVAYIERHMAGS